MINFLLHPMGINLAADEDGGAEVSLVITMGAPLPFEQGPGTGPIMVPISQVTVPLDKEFATSLGAALTEAAGKMKKKTDLAIVDSLAGVDKAAQFEGTEGMSKVEIPLADRYAKAQAAIIDLEKEVELTRAINEAAIRDRHWALGSLDEIAKGRGKYAKTAGDAAEWIRVTSRLQDES